MRTLISSGSSDRYYAAPANTVGEQARRIVLLPVVVALAVGFGASEIWRSQQRTFTADGKRIYTLYMGRAESTEVRLHVATFDLDEQEADANSNQCGRMRNILQNRTSNGLTFWCEVGRYHQ